MMHLQCNGRGNTVLLATVGTRASYQHQIHHNFPFMANRHCLLHDGEGG